jgi:hypothetical protein
MTPHLTEAVRSLATIDMTPHLTEAVRSLATIDMTPHLTEAVRSLAKARADILGSMSMQLAAVARPLNWWSSMLADNLATTSRVAADVAAITEALALSSQSLVSSSAHRLQLGVGQVVGAHHRHMAASMEGLLTGLANPAAADLILRPTAITAGYTGVARGIAIPMPTDRLSKDLSPDVVDEFASRLEDLGAHAAARDLRAAHDTLRRRLPGWSKSGPHLLREVIREALDEWAPPSLVPPDTNGHVTKRAQVMWIVGGDHTLGVFVDVAATNVGRLHSLLSAEAKNSGSPRVGHQGLVGLLEVVMGLMRIMADQVTNRGTEG